MRVAHKKFGRGMIVSIEGETAETNFESEGEKTVVPCVLPLGILEVVD